MTGSSGMGLHIELYIYTPFTAIKPKSTSTGASWGGLRVEAALQLIGGGGGYAAAAMAVTEWAVSDYSSNLYSPKW